KTYEMEQVIPGEDWNDPDSDPIIESVDLLHAGAVDDARRVLQQCLTQDTRCIDAYVHLGNIRFRHYHSEIAVEQALKSYRAGVAVGEQALPEGFNGLLLWGYIDNRPFLRALHGLALCEWRLGRTSCARSVFMRLLMLDPDDALRVRFSMHALDCGLSYVDYADEEVC
ncbi:MAG: cytoplasmic protein, partial [Bacillota bacterium]|nr:cytoplasmic protein [Bacillota bacterium]